MAVSFSSVCIIEFCCAQIIECQDFEHSDFTQNTDFYFDNRFDIRNTSKIPSQTKGQKTRRSPGDLRNRIPVKVIEVIGDESNGTEEEIENRKTEGEYSQYFQCNSNGTIRSYQRQSSENQCRRFRKNGTSVVCISVALIKLYKCPRYLISHLQKHPSNKSVGDTRSTDPCSVSYSVCTRD